MYLRVLETTIKHRYNTKEHAWEGMKRKRELGALQGAERQPWKLRRGLLALC